MSICDKIRPSNVDEDVTDEICYGSSNMTVCEVYVKEGEINGTYINTCTKFCREYRLRCIDAFEAEDECVKDMNAAIDCDDEFTKPGILSSKDNICSCAKIGKHCS